MQELLKSGAQDVQAGALETVGNLAFCKANRWRILHTPTLMERLAAIAHSSLAATTTLGRHAACRALAILGELVLRHGWHGQLLAHVMDGCLAGRRQVEL